MRGPAAVVRDAFARRMIAAGWATPAEASKLRLTEARLTSHLAGYIQLCEDLRKERDRLGLDVVALKLQLGARRS